MPRRSPSKREQQVSKLLEGGKSPEEAADELGIALATVNIHRYKAARRQSGDPQLSKRQREIVSCLALGLTTEEVAVHLGIARGTAVNHRAMAALALGLGSVVQLTHYAILQGWVQAGDALSPERIDAALAKVANDVGALQR